MKNIFDLFKKTPQQTSTISWEALEPILAPYQRTTWIPEVSEQASSPVDSKFAGIPALLNGEAWPSCPHCQQPLQLFLQLNAKDLLPEVDHNLDNGILQLFYCTNEATDCEVANEAYFPFADSTLVRIIQTEGAEITSPTHSPVPQAFPEKTIIGWFTKTDYPNTDELATLGCELSDEEAKALYDKNYPQAGDKLLGWPYWIQGLEYPTCPECGETMQFLFQIDSEDNLPFMFGDAGCAHLTQCKNHPHILAFAWACY